MVDPFEIKCERLKLQLAFPGQVLVALGLSSVFPPVLSQPSVALHETPLYRFHTPTVPPLQFRGFASIFRAIVIH